MTYLILFRPPFVPINSQLSKQLQLMIVVSVVQEGVADTSKAHNLA